MDIYRAAIRPILFSGLKADPEWLHQKTLQVLGWLDRTHDRIPTTWIDTQLKQSYGLTHSHLEQTLWG